MSRRKKVLLGIASVMPLVLMLVYFGAFGALWLTNGLDEGSDVSPVLVALLAVSIVISVFGGWAMVLYYVVWLFRQPYADDSKRTLWTVLLLVVNAMALPVFWFLFIWREESLAPDQPQYAYWPPPPPPPFVAH